MIGNGKVCLSKTCILDNSFYLHALKIKNELSHHTGCVNTICWNESGEYILSGSDDRKIAIVQAFSSVFIILFDV